MGVAGRVAVESDAEILCAQLPGAGGKRPDRVCEEDWQQIKMGRDQRI
jgi:hypothetical protein